MSAERWARLAGSLLAAGIEAKVDVTAYPGGTSRSIDIRTDAGLVHVGDKYWSKNADAWIGWQVTREDAGSIIRWSSRISKKRSEVVAAVSSAMAREVLR
jgi:hypothetical protein